MSKYSAKIDELCVQFGEAESRKNELAKEKKIKEKEKEKELREAEKEKKFAERFGKHFAESSKDMDSRVCHLEESMAKMLEMSEKYLKGNKE